MCRWHIPVSPETGLMVQVLLNQPPYIWLPLALHEQSHTAHSGENAPGEIT